MGNATQTSPQNPDTSAFIARAFMSESDPTTLVYMDQVETLEPESVPSGLVSECERLLGGHLACVRAAVVRDGRDWRQARLGFDPDERTCGVYLQLSGRWFRITRCEVMS